ncbi:glucose-fructose oxidoreductase domain-containing protein 1 [Parasteatoda tepidariorum]|uniref:glucose-fructose oxidoreductase domain-containing protein 1 n=1 Tax=Parasteatoda tepidariorum TaxID=114398 RepID=UPI00077FC914|nr:glucose-fructose oxidoreductase domain-containing protein 1-like [Parasteatoda tepidariorum]
MLPSVGVFGTGKIIRVLVPCLRSRGFKVEAIWGRSKETAEKIAKELEIPFFTDKVDEVLLRKGVDLVCIICPPHLHSQITVKALGIGKHVLCDRPAGLCQTEVLKMVHAAQYYPSLISVLFHSLRFLPAFAQMRKAVKEGYIGDLTICDVQVQCGSLLHDHYDWSCDALMGGGLLTNVGSHIIDIIAYTTGQRAKRVHGMVKTFTKTCHFEGIRQITSDDFCAFQMELEGGGCATVTLNEHLPGQFSQEVLLCGSNGYVVVRGGDLYGQKINSIKEEVLYLDIEDLKQSSAMSFNNINMSVPDSAENLLPKPYMKGLVKMVGALKEAFASQDDLQSWVKEPVAIAASFEDGQYIQAVIDSIRLSSKQREWVKVELMSEDPETQQPLLSSLP